MCTAARGCPRASRCALQKHGSSSDSSRPPQQACRHACCALGNPGAAPLACRRRWVTGSSPGMSCVLSGRHSRRSRRARRWRRRSTTEGCMSSRWTPQVGGRAGGSASGRWGILRHVPARQAAALLSFCSRHRLCCSCVHTPHPHIARASCCCRHLPPAALVRPYASEVARAPELTSIYMTSGLDVPLESRDWGWLGSEQDVAHLGGAGVHASPPSGEAAACLRACLPHDVCPVCACHPTTHLPSPHLHTFTGTSSPLPQAW